jgi:hypothetical protein
VQFWGKNIQHPKKSIFNDWSVSENQFNVVFYNKIYTIKNVSCWKKSEWIDLQYKIIITKYINIAIAFPSVASQSAESQIAESN